MGSGLLMLSSGVLRLCKQLNIAHATFLHLSAMSDP